MTTRYRRCRPAVIALLVVLAAALVTLPLHAAAVETFKVTDGFLQENKVYTQKTILDLTGLDNTRKVSSTATVANGKIQSLLYISGGDGSTPSDTFTTSLYMTCTKMDITTPNGQSFYYIEYLPPNAYIVLKETTSYKTDGYRSIAIQTGWDYNTTLVIVDSVLEDSKGTGPSAFTTFSPSNGRPHSLVDNCVMHVKNMKVIKHQGLISFSSSLEQQSALVFEDIEGVNLRGPVFTLTKFVIKDHSAIIVMRLKNTHDINSNLKFILDTTTLEVDTTSAFSLIDLDASNGFKENSIGAFNSAATITGAGEIVFSRLLMQKSGLATKQPQTNTNFWVSARMAASTDLTAAQLEAQKFNVNSKNVMKWDGTGADGKTCAPAGGSIPGRATYKLVGGKCVATCKEGFIPPACTAPATSQCKVDNCDLCYRVTKTKCMMCATHTAHENNDQKCSCPANLENCQVCPGAATCATCVEGYNLTKGNAPCFPCSKTVPNCFHCDEPNVCEQCIPHYNVSANKKECYSCPAANCLHCSGNGICDECAPHYNLSAIDKPQNSCISCKVPNCLLCKEDDNCDTCAPDYTKPQGKTTCAHCPIEHCERCDVDGVCAKCPDTHTPVDGKHCHPCTMPGCLKCDGDEQCADCDDKYTLVNKKCISCDIPHCKTCLTDGVCNDCDATYHLLDDGGVTTCVHCDIANCDSCHVDGICHECAPHYNLSAIDKPQNSCISCKVPNCLLCKEDDKCDTCAPDYTKPQGKTTCAHCPIEHCERCDVDGVCAKCPDTHTPVDGKHCHPCTMPGCLKCDGDEQCADCDDKYTLVNKKCISCDIPHCKTCLVDGVCNDCDATYHLLDDGGVTTCVHCDIPHCKSCLADGVCGKCEPKYTLHNDGALSECISCDIDGCSTCDSDSHCSACANANPPVDDGKVCVSCEVPNCVYCNATDSCAECSDRYSLSDVDAKLTCISCNVDHCLLCGATDTCQQCEPSYNASKSGDKCSSCFVADCHRCDEDGVCAQCGISLSVSLNGGECTPCDIGNCTYCSLAGECGLCVCGLIPTTNGKECVPCTAANCKHCDLPGDGKKCAECVEGYDVSDGSCKKSGLPSWVVFLIVVAATVIAIASFAIGVFLYLRHQANVRQMERDAEERRRNRQAKGQGARHFTEIGILDLGDIEGAASGVRDNQNQTI